MPTVDDDLLVAFELHSVEAIRRALDAGADPIAPIRGKSPVTWLVEMYTRSNRFPGCLRVLLERGAVLDDPVLAPVLLDDAEALRAALRERPEPLPRPEVGRTRGVTVVRRAGGSRMRPRAGDQ